MRKKIILITFAFFNFAAAGYAEEKIFPAEEKMLYSYSDDKHLFEVEFEWIGEFDEFQKCHIKTISVYKNQDKKFIQKIELSQEEGGSYRCKEKQNMFRLEDINFDGIGEFIFVDFLPAGPNVPYKYWVFDVKTGQFKQDESLEEITSPVFNKTRKSIVNFWRDGCCMHGRDVYKYINGAITLMERCIDNEQSEFIEIAQLKKGKMQLHKKIKKTPGGSGGFSCEVSLYGEKG